MPMSGASYSWHLSVSLGIGDNTPLLVRPELDPEDGEPNVCQMPANNVEEGFDFPDAFVSRQFVQTREKLLKPIIEHDGAYQNLERTVAALAKEEEESGASAFFDVVDMVGLGGPSHFDYQVTTAKVLHLTWRRYCVWATCEACGCEALGDMLSAVAVQAAMPGLEGRVAAKRDPQGPTQVIKKVKPCAGGQGTCAGNGDCRATILGDYVLFKAQDPECKR
ncbi:hypothetical protein PpBr36_01433 [Pyricularia pennisetigena]|uniref:hypothetical protein n=1 Tax=Pyricularia pennisetigena TaxID=1578925 RepID=UPI0011504992|nr:hypothetical protein PpBr36_01433 [Pyricularia pennisetigena]TLS28373.1 hypothetical protein PpBr36_01433 [Pyricularia pennisetigena]